MAKLANELDPPLSVAEMLAASATEIQKIEQAGLDILADATQINLIETAQSDASIVIAADRNTALAQIDAAGHAGSGAGG